MELNNKWWRRMKKKGIGRKWNGAHCTESDWRGLIGWVTVWRWGGEVRVMEERLGG